MPIINHIMMTESKGEVNFEQLARKQLPPPEEYPDWKHHRLYITVSPEDHGIESLKDEIQCCYQVQRKTLTEPAAWTFVHCRKREYKEVRQRLREKQARKEKERAAKK